MNIAIIKEFDDYIEVSLEDINKIDFSSNENRECFKYVQYDFDDFDEFYLD